jgi:hypothetical protein
MKVNVFENTKLWINSVEYTIEKGIQEVEEHIAEVLLKAKAAEKIEEKEEKGKRK